MGGFEQGVMEAKVTMQENWPSPHYLPTYLSIMMTQSHFLGLYSFALSAVHGISLYVLSEYSDENLLTGHG